MKQDGTEGVVEPEKTVVGVRFRSTGKLMCSHGISCVGALVRGASLLVTAASLALLNTREAQRLQRKNSESGKFLRPFNFKLPITRLQICAGPCSGKSAFAECLSIV